LTDLNRKIHETLELRKTETYHRLDKLSERISNMDMYFEDEKMKILKYIDDRGEELSKLLHRFKEEFDEDRALRLEREAIIVKQLTDHEQEVSERFEKQIVSLLYPEHDQMCLLTLFRAALFTSHRSLEKRVILRCVRYWRTT